MSELNNPRVVAMPRPHRARPLAVLACIAAIACSLGCVDWTKISTPTAESTDPAADPSDNDDAPAVRPDPFTVVEMQSGDAKYIAAARPFIEAIVARNYTDAFGHLAPSARQRLSRNQFVPADNDQGFARHDSEAIENPTAEQFVEFVQATEKFYGPPEAIDFITVETDPEILTRKDPVMAAFELGNMPDSIPVASRKAAVQTTVYTRLSDEDVASLAESEGITAEQIRADRADYEGPYFKLRTVIIDEGAGPVVGYFEIAPPSIWD